MNQGTFQVKPLYTNTQATVEYITEKESESEIYHLQ